MGWACSIQDHLKVLTLEAVVVEQCPNFTH